MAGHVTAIRLRQFVDPAPEIPPGIIHHQGKDILGYYPGQLARLHFEYPPEGQPKPFTKLQPVPVKHETVLHHGFDHLVLKQYIHYQRTKKSVCDWYTQTTYREAFTLPCYKSDSTEDRYCPRTIAESLAIWKSTSAKRRDKVKPSFMGV
ncbi:protein SPMIP3 [Elgaria multicarinata webbii]|uniref:protein SPMIP3 n=1 Tax=Elgaria multicarinata webbii TaxID=159646 RepID=UPI002FCCC3A8